MQEQTYHGCTIRTTNLGFSVYSPHGWRVGIRKSLKGAQQLAARTAAQFAQ
jgi:hypothetical protein